ncbi:MAG TPA: GIY-YIG nuclease family protein [Candidatus Pacearchaeota archaeon]|nr:GIY-YIG nuclease family protein [Candidatus Pacearchaeota archaeon]
MDDVLKNKIEGLPDGAGVYFFKDVAERVIYVGKAKNLKKRVKNHFQKPDQHSFDFVSQIAGIDFIQTSSEKEALLLEQQFIKKLQPRWNVEWKDDKNYFYIALSNEQFPRVYLTHQIKKPTGVEPLIAIRGSTPVNFGPYVSGREVKSFLKEIRKALPYRSCRNLPKKPCFYHSLGLCPAPCANKNKKAKKNYNGIMALLRILLSIYQGKTCVGDTYANSLRVEGYDVSNLQGTLAVGSMAVFEGGLPNKNEYRKFKIKTVNGQNDVASLAEILKRRMKRQEWPLPDLILIDGGKGQLKSAKNIDIPTIALAKIGDSDGKLFTKFSRNYAQLSKLPPNLSNLFLQIRDEAHRFAIGYNKKRRKMLIE